ncbi:MAG: glycogen-binding domain-containing protein [Candidatus Krumholzibacteriia bacterium]
MMGTSRTLRVLAVVLAVLALAGCDRTTKRGPAGGAPEQAAGPRSADGGILFVFEDPGAQSVHLAGTFNDWSTSADPMTRDAQGGWTVVKPLAPGTHQYKFVINGGQQWKEDPDNPHTTDDGFGGHNSVLVVTASGVKVQPAPAVPGAGAEVAGGGGPKKVEKGWLFSVHMPGAQTVHLAGSFNSWSTTADPMTRDEEGTWTIVRQIPSGSHQYKFVIDGGQEWKEDPDNPNTADDGYGGSNSVLVVP